MIFLTEPRLARRSWKGWSCSWVCEGQAKSESTSLQILFRYWFSVYTVDSKISMTFDSWTSTNGDPFLSVTAHYVSVCMDNPQQWELQSDQLSFTPIVGNHSGENIANILIETIDRYGIQDKVCCPPSVRHICNINQAVLAGWLVHHQQCHQQQYCHCCCCQIYWSIWRGLGSSPTSSSVSFHI